MDFYVIVLGVLLLVSLVIIYELANKPAPVCPPCQIMGPYSQMPSTVPDPIVARDRAVLSDPLYPPGTRDHAVGAERLLREPRLHPRMSSDYPHDSFQVVGYLINQEDREDVWKLMARYTNRSRSAEFFAESSNRKLDMKVPLTRDVAKAADGSNIQPFRDLDTLPSSVTIKHPMFREGAVYEVVELPRTQLGGGYI